MQGPIFEYYYLIRFEILALFLVCGAVTTVFWVLLRRWQRRQKALEQELSECQTDHFQKLYGYFQRIVAHEYGKGLDYILNKSSETLEGLGKEQTNLRDKQDGIITKANDLKQHAMNILSVFALEPDILKKELLNIRQLVESVLLELYPYAESQGVALRPNLDDIEPIILDRDLTVLAIRNLVHNAIKYSERGRVVEIRLTSEEDEARPGKEIAITVKDRGRGIQDVDKDTLFKLNMRGDGLVETGNGLGLYCTRKAASLQGGDVILVSSSPGQGSVFKIRFPVVTAGEVIQETELEPPKRSWVVLRWGAAIVGLLVAATLLYYLFKPPQQVAILSYHDRYVTALDENSDWRLTQVLASELGECGWFTQLDRGYDDLGNKKVALLTCHDRFVTAPWRANPSEPGDNHDPQWLLWQEPGLGECEQFALLSQDDDKVAFGTCAGMVVTAGDGFWPGDMAWSVVAEKDEIKEWEKFTLAPMP